MTPAELLREGRLSQARESLVERIKAAPADTKARTLFFQVLAYCGEWDKAEKHLEILITQSPETATGVLVYRNLVAAERARVEVASGRQIPDFMTDAPPYLAGMLEARKALADGEHARFAKMMAKVEKQIPGVSGMFDGVPFTGLFECDTTLSGMLEVFVHDRYLWFPIASLRELSIQKPNTLLETLWAPSRIVTWDGLTTDCFLPVLYPGSAAHDNDQIRMGRMTDWIELAKGCYRGVGQHLFQLGKEDKGLLELQDVTFNLPK